MSDHPVQISRPAQESPIKDASNLSFVKAAFFVVLGALIIIIWDLVDGVALMADIDDGVRKAQINDLLADGNWYDRRLPGIVDYNSHWSRLVDAPYYLLTKGLSLFMPLETAALWAHRLIPIGLLIVLIGFFTAIIQRISALSGQVHPPMAAFIIAPIMALILSLIHI